MIIIVRPTLRRQTKHLVGIYLQPTDMADISNGVLLVLRAPFGRCCFSGCEAYVTRLIRLINSDSRRVRWRYSAVINDYFLLRVCACVLILQLTYARSINSCRPYGQRIRSNATELGQDLAT